MMDQGPFSVAGGKKRLHCEEKVPRPANQSEHAAMTILIQDKCSPGPHGYRDEDLVQLGVISRNVE